MEKEKRNLIKVLNEMFEDELKKGDKRTKSGKDQLNDNANTILTNCVVKKDGPELIGKKPCLISTASLDGRGRGQRKIRVDKSPINFRPWHVTWISQFGLAPTGLQYSHRCHTINCVEPSHGLWETDGKNKERSKCRSHLILQDGRIFLLCDHNPCCYNPLRIIENDSRFIKKEDIN
jgi:hypothetical protein